MNVADNSDFSPNEAGHKIYNLPVELIKANPFQPRQHFEPMALVDLATSIKQYGLMQPISVRTADGGYELVAGERRLRATKLAGLDSINAMIIDITDEQSAVMALVENLQRQNLNYIEEAEGFSRLIADHSLTQEELARKLGKSQSSIANKLRLLKLPPKVKKALIDNELSERHARALLLALRDQPGIDTEQIMLEIIDKILTDGLTAQKTEALIEKYFQATTEKPSKKTEIKMYMRDMRIFTNTVKEAIGIMQDSGVDATYDMQEEEGGCTITVKVKY